MKSQFEEGELTCVGGLHSIVVTRHWQLQEDLMAAASWANFETWEWKGELSCEEGDSARLLFHFLMRPRLTNYCCKRGDRKKQDVVFFSHSQNDSQGDKSKGN